MSAKEAKARIKINELLKNAGWRFFDEGNKPANIQVETNVKLTEKQINDMGEDFDKAKNGFVDFLLLDDKGKPYIVLEAKSEDKDPLTGKEQARDYANSLFVKFVILSNGNLHYFWNVQKGNPQVIIEFPSFESLSTSRAQTADISKLYSEPIEADYIALTQMPRYMDNPDYINENKRGQFCEDNKLRFLRKYQIEAMKALQLSAKKGNQRFLYEMATGTGKTLTSAAVIKLFLRTGMVSRVLFLVDRIELENQANDKFISYLKNDYVTIKYKEHPDDWRKADIVVSTVQTLMSDNRYRKIFKPTDFDLIISDEAHRSISGNSRAVFEYFLGFKLGLTATPKDYIKNINVKKLSQNDPRAWEKRQLLDTYKIFGCESSDPTYRYSLLDGVREGFLINPIVVDARTDITTQLLSDEGYAVINTATEPGDDDGEETDVFYGTDFEKKFFSDETNKIFVKTFLENAMRDPLTGEIGKSIIFCVSRKHAGKITQLLNELADAMFPCKYQSDFALQITSDITNAQLFTINFQNNNLRGTTAFLEDYKSSKTRVCVTVGMMTTGYDCEDILNIGLLRPIFSPTDFVQIKGRGTRIFTFKYNERLNGETVKHEAEKEKFKLFDFFCNCEYFEEKYDYDEVLKLPPRVGAAGGTPPPPPGNDTYENTLPDPIKTIKETPIGFDGMKIDRKLYEKFEEKVKEVAFVREQYESGNIKQAEQYIVDELFDKPQEFFNMEKLRRAIGVDRRISLREILDKIFGTIPTFKSRAELIEDEFQAYLLTHKVSNAEYYHIHRFFEAYIADRTLAGLIDEKKYVRLNVECSSYTYEELHELGQKNMKAIVEYIKDNVNLSKFEKMAG